MNRYLELLNSQKFPKRRNGLNFVSLFSGGGGLDLGFSLGGFKGLYSTDVVEHYCNTIRYNFKKHIVECKDMNDLSGHYVKDKIQTDNIDMIVGGPPCQSFSILGNRKSTGDPRGRLVFEYARFIKEVAPAGFLFENVPGILSVNDGQDWKDLLAYFKDETGYHLRWRKLNAVNFGAPQIRERVILLGFKDEPFDKWPSPIYKIDGLNGSKAFKSQHALQEVDGLPNHIKRVHSERVSSRYSLIPQGGRCKVDFTDRINQHKPSGTVLVGSSGGGGRPFIHPIEHRHITVREAARLQSFPDWYVFQGPGTAQYRQVGNAVAPLFAKALSKEIRKHITSIKKNKLATV